MAANTKEQVFKYSLADTNTNDSLAEFGISIRDSRLTFEKQFQIPLRERIDLQFFPEGGKLVSGLESKVAFKAIGTDGLSREVKGEIKDENENIITSFESSHKGMGAFLLKPKAGEKYFAHLWYNNLKYVIPLPSASEEGCTMSVGYTGNGKNLFLAIKQIPHEAITQKYVIGSAHGKILFSALVKMVKDSSLFQIPLELLPEGVCRLTVLGGDFKPECERLIYVDKNERFKVEVLSDSSSYGTRSKVTLMIKTTGEGGVPVQADLSLAVVDKEQITGETKTGGICAYKLLESELQGYIEDAGFYFKDDSCVNTVALDLLMLTQGYRNFMSCNTKSDELKFRPEKNFEVSGNIKFGGSRSREKKFNYRDIDLSLICFFEKPYIEKSKPDSLGRFRFQIPLLNGKSRSLMQATKPNGKPFYGDIFINEAFAPSRFGLPLSSRFNMTTPSFEYVRRLQTVKKTEISKNPYYGIKTIILPEVTVKARAKNWYLNFEHDAKKIVDLDSLDPNGDKYENIYDLLVREFGAKWNFGWPRTILLPSDRSMGSGLSHFFPIYVINEQIYWNGAGLYLEPLETLGAMNANEIKRIMVIPPHETLSNYYSSWDIRKNYIYQSLVVIETYSNFSYRGDPLGSKTFDLEGLNAPRVFYSPRYDGPMRKSPVYDGRTTLYWEPSIRTDAKGEAKVEFFTSDRQTSLVVVVAGIEVGSGNPGQGQTLINSTLNKLKK